MINTFEWHGYCHRCGTRESYDIWWDMVFCPRCDNTPPFTPFGKEEL